MWLTSPREKTRPVPERVVYGTGIEVGHGLETASRFTIGKAHANDPGDLAIAVSRPCGRARPGLVTGAAGASEGVLTAHANNDVENVASLQRGARNFVNYCMGCHSAEYVRYNGLAQDLQISEQQLIDNLMFAAQKPQETMTIAMRPDDAQRWFGVAPPDLSLIARSRGADYLFNFLRGFYVDPARPTGVNNADARRMRRCLTCCGSCRARRRPFSWTSRLPAALRRRF